MIPARRPVLLLALAGVAAFAMPVFAQGGGTRLAPQLVAHRATYDLTLASATGAKAPNSARGRIAFDFSGSPCEGYSQNFRQFTELDPAEGPSRVSDMTAVTFEDGDGRTFRFKVETRIDNTGLDQVDGRAARSNDGALSVSLSRPKRAQLDLDKDILFPTAHMMRILEAARAGRPIVEAKVFDGSDTGDKIYDTMTVIGRPSQGEVAEKAAQLPQLRDMRRWPVAISYFEEGKKDSTPHYVLSFDLYENGVSRALRLDYGDFVLKGEMTKLELLPSKPCAR